jgi:2-polyprenyl-6-hydroxyphenyl methylase/3-demethylubiquinone-9 3-methyltransferase
MNSEQIQNNVDHAEVSKFDAMAARWWDPDGEFRPLHDLNPVRLRFIRQHADIVGKQVLDIGCGGGILSEAMAKAGAKVTGIDAASKALAVAKLHAMESGIEVDYRAGTCR